MTTTDLQRIMHIDRHCEDITSFIERFGNSYETFISDTAYYNAVAMSIFQIGEVANGLSEEFIAKTKEKVQWRDIRGMRNWIGHSYDRVNDEVLWETATEDIPILRKFCSSILEQEQ